MVMRKAFTIYLIIINLVAQERPILLLLLLLILLILLLWAAIVGSATQKLRQRNRVQMPRSIHSFLPSLARTHANSGSRPARCFSWLSTSEVAASICVK